MLRGTHGSRRCTITSSREREREVTLFVVDYALLVVSLLLLYNNTFIIRSNLLYGSTALLVRSFIL